MHLFPVIGLYTAVYQFEKREVYAGDTNLTCLKRAPGLLELGGNFLLGQTAEISNTESLNRSVAAKHSQLPQNCSENHRILKQWEKNNSSPHSSAPSWVGLPVALSGSAGLSSLKGIYEAQQ